MDKADEADEAVGGGVLTSCGFIMAVCVFSDFRPRAWRIVEADSAPLLERRAKKSKPVGEQRPADPADRAAIVHFAPARAYFVARRWRCPGSRGTVSDPPLQGSAP
ncbi:hypothetical protein D8B25_14340 [Verminephrobacter aporrectodeae subsp. tuberculatae]|nr:hypothetical protein [Verminephrobacter aporrectodeae subsp. tuberculatae]